MHKLREKLTYANVMVTLLAFIVLGGGAYAATSLPANSVGTAQLRAGAVTKAKIAKATRDSLRGEAGAPGSAGAVGPVGPQGPAGEPGAPGAASESTLVFARVESVPLDEPIYGAPSGVSSAANSFSKVAMAVPFETAVEVEKLSVRLSSLISSFCSPLATCKMQVSLLVNDVTIALSCAPVALTCSTGSASATIPAGTTIGLELIGIEASGPPMNVMVTWRVSPA